MVRAHTEVMTKPAKHGSNRLRILTAPPVNIKDFSSSLDKQQQSQQHHSSQQQQQQQQSHHHHHHHPLHASSDANNLSMELKSKLLKTEADDLSYAPGDGILRDLVQHCQTGGGSQKHHDQHGQSASLQRQSLTLGGKSLRSYGSSTTATSNNNKYGGGRNDDKSCRDYSITQHAIIDDDNASQHQTPKYQGALTLASQWKSQFDDSDDSTDGLWKGEQHSENASKKNYTNLNKSSIAAAAAATTTQKESALPPQPPPPPPPSQPPQPLNGTGVGVVGGGGVGGTLPATTITTTTISTMPRNGHHGGEHGENNNGIAQPPPQPPPPPSDCDEVAVPPNDYTASGGKLAALIGPSTILPDPEPVVDAVSLLPCVGIHTTSCMVGDGKVEVEGNDPVNVDKDRV
uniref:Uncharacterized protein n=1 Tax=Anopheles maculatus TaxID=74869 RepID=A0A182T6Q8_9DIPT